ncbi:hypothetical protein AKJ51_00725 [candidate division MSBL1 archaeon SCGC-AAA382A20]|uniref:Uncharacterized protein n=1 Tax=candidate division MSBL1 archaeon SCGC-AAA382A20 TaxID=1698280 RepID=A0A133VMD0_9EURY|nr:hypothetical protein AKJ51_00725 [candidate division MSBL1 archaeon SCGC-AAA382A20]
MKLCYLTREKNGETISLWIFNVDKGLDMLSRQFKYSREELDQDLRSVFARTIREFIKDSDLNYNQLAGISELSRTTIRKAEKCDQSGRSLPSLRTIMFLLDALQVGVGEFTGKLNIKAAEMMDNQTDEIHKDHLRMELPDRTVHIEVILGEEKGSKK